MNRIIAIIAIIIALTITSDAVAWNCATHTLIAQEAGYTGIDACAPDEAKTLEERSFKHWKNTPADIHVTKDNFNTLPYDGNLYEKLVELKGKATLTVIETQELVHAAGDISQPLHNAAYDDYNKAQHKAYDNIPVTAECLTVLPVPTDAVTYAAEIAEQARVTAYTHAFTQEQACYAVSQSVALAKALHK
ncbi:MAG: hypothetical protein RBR68_15480 [Tenuifilaceae bacterium]|nr:hypothetical protein [Tenuifilaceae bacterium]